MIDNETEDNRIFLNAVREYTTLRDKVFKTFISDLVDLGSILHKYREYWKQKNKWLAYCEAIGIHISAANQQIRLYEYWRDNNSSDKKLMAEIVTNWSKLNKFLSLQEDEKDNLLEQGLTGNETSAEFTEVLDAMISIEEEENEVEVNGDVKLLNMNSYTPGYNTRKEAKILRKVLNFSGDSILALESLVDITRAEQSFSLPDNLEPNERQLIKEHIENVLVDLLNKVKSS